MAKPAGTIALLLAIAVLAILSSSASAQSACAAGTALMNQANAQELTEDCDTLLSARDTLAGTGILNWSGSLGIDEWDGVSVDGSSGRVTGLNLRAAGLDGQIPVELGNLDQLESLHLGENRLNGEIPSEIGRLDALQMLYLNANRLTGNIPAELGSFGRLQRMYLNGNQLDGGIPPALGGLASLRVLSVSQNLMVGEIPVELGLLGNLEELYLNANQLSGEIPAELGDLSSLERLYLNGNQFTGMIPTALGSLTNLRVLSLSQNQLTGEIPSELGSLTSLQSLYLDGNQLDGMTPTALGGLANLQHLRLSGNQLTGCVPHTLLGAIIDAQPLGLPTCEAPATPGSLTVVIDVDGPRAPVRLNTPIGLTATFSQPVADFTADDISVAYGTVANFEGTGLSYTFDVTPSAAGPVTVDIPAGSATDASGNGNAAADQLLIGISYDDNDDAGISKREAITAIIDYFDRHITKAQAIGVIGLYFTSPVVIPRVANAGPDTEALESSTVMLDGTATTGPEGSISFYRWEQVINGSRLVSLTGTDIASPTFTLPRLSNNQDFAFRLTVTYNNGETSQDEVTITGRPLPGVIVGAVSGHTAVLNAVAEFGVRLRSRPSADVVIPIFSSNESEGVPEQTEVVFTPENWQEEQIVSVRGQNANVRGGVQNYEIILGDMQSADSFYEGLEVANVAMKGISLEIMGPERLDSLIANIPAVIQPGVSYTGSYLLSYALVDAPEGMSIDFNNGTIFWTPAESNKGQTINVTVRVNDGALFAETTFSVVVVAPQEIETEIIESEVDGNKLTVTDEDTDVEGLEITSPPDEAALDTEQLEELQEALGKVAPESVPEIPSRIKRISDVFVVQDTFDSPVELRFPVGDLPVGVEPYDIHFYTYIDPLIPEGPFWSPLAITRSIEVIDNIPVYVLSLSDLEGFGFFGYQNASLGTSLEDSSVSREHENSMAFSKASDVEERQSPEDTSESLVEGIQCVLSHLLISEVEPTVHICTVGIRETLVIIRVENFGRATTRWGDVTLDELASWLIRSQSVLDELGLNYDTSFTVRLEPMDGDRVGFVSGRGEDWKILHVDPDQDRRTIQNVVLHEYFHHAQARSQGSGVYAVLDTYFTLFRTLSTAWLVEGTAVWFPDEIFDELNQYQDYHAYPILETGLNNYREEQNPVPILGDIIRAFGPIDPREDPYARGLFFRLISQENVCPGFRSRIADIFSSNNLTDSSGIKKLVEVLQDEDTGCNFGNHLGEDRSSSIEAAIAFYNYATLFKIDARLLDDNEDFQLFQFSSLDASNKTFPADFATVANSGDYIEIKGLLIIPAVGAFSVHIPRYGQPVALPPGKIAELLFVPQSTNEIVVSITGKDGEFVGTNQIGRTGSADPHHWLTLNGRRVSYTYGGNSSALPPIFLTFINPSLDHDAWVKVYFRIRDDREEDTLSPIITSHSDGEQVSNRVISITGSIPEEVRDEVDRVVITANGLETDTDLRSDGTFTEQVLMFLGNNVITAQGVTGNTAVTELASITLEGVEGSSSGRNQLVSTRVGFVLRWDTDRTDVDLYSTDQFGSTIWYGEKVQAPGFLDVDDVSGLGPEVISYRSPAHDVYVDGTFDVDVHYYRGAPETNFTLDVILNETDGNNRRLYRYRSITPLTDADTVASNRPTGASGTSRFNDIVKVRCSGAGVCQMSQFDHTKLASVGETGVSHSVSRDTGSTRSAAAQGDDYEQCMRELKLAQEESQSSQSSKSSKSSCGEAEAEEGVQ